MRYERTDPGVATLVLDDPDRRNALSEAMLDALVAALERARDDAEVRCVVLASSHPKVFSAGGDLTAFGSAAPIIHKHLANTRFPEVFRLLGTLGKPSVCAAGGHVLAGAFGLALACDLIVAKDTAQFGTPEINVGVFPFMITALIGRNVPRKKAVELLLLGERVSAAEGAHLGFVNKVVDEAGFEAAVANWAQKLAAKSPLLMRLGKDALYRQGDMGFEDALDYLRAQLTLALATDDAREGVGAFLEKREPRWTGH